MKTGLARLLPLFLLAPYICAYVPNPDGDEEYSIAIAAGRGMYADVSRDCNGNIVSIDRHGYDDVAAQFAGRYDKLTFGVAGGRTTALQVRYPEGPLPVSPVLYCSPKIGIAVPIVGFDVGALVSVNGNLISLDRGIGRTVYPTLGLRIGKMSSLHFSGGYLNNFPLVSGGGVVDLGLGGPVGPSGRSQLWFGLGAMPYDGAMLSVKGDLLLMDHLSILPAFHGSVSEAGEFGLALGVKYSL